MLRNVRLQSLLFLRSKLRPSLRSSRTLYPCSTRGSSMTCPYHLHCLAQHCTASPFLRTAPHSPLSHQSALLRIVAPPQPRPDSSSLLSLSVLPIVLALPRQSRTLPRQSRMAVSATLWHSLSHIVAPSQTIKGQSLSPVFPQFLAGFNLSHLQLNPSIPLRVAFLHKLCSWLRRNKLSMQDACG